MIAQRFRGARHGMAGLRPPTIVTVAAVLFVIPALARAQDCQNQIEIDVCKAGCTATGEVCGALCGAAVDVCTGVCIGGCATTCAVDCCFGFCTGDDDCRSCINNCENTCEEGCQLECDDCIFDCERDCQSICRPFRKVGEFCTPLVDRCASGLVCWPLPFPGELRPRCFPDEEDSLYPDDTCRSLYSSGLHEGAIDTGLTMSYGSGSSFAAGVILVNELGTVYSPDGRYGCYVTSCVGGIVDVEVGVYAAVGFYTSYDDFRGQSIVFSEEAGGEIIAFATSQIINTSGDLIGTADALSFEVSLVPIFTAGVFDCATIVDTVGLRDPSTGALIPVDNSPPTAVCADRKTCAGADTCTATANVDDGSSDPDGDSLTLTQSPAGPYAIGEHTVTLSVTDAEAESDSCTALVVVNDCTQPQIECPPAVIVECEGDGGTVLDPGMATVTDCTDVTVEEPGMTFFPVGTTEAEYKATDAAGNESTCTTAVTVEDTAAPIITSATATPDMLWPPDHEMRRVEIDVVAMDTCDPDLACEIVSVEVEDLPWTHPGNGRPNDPPGNGNPPNDPPGNGNPPDGPPGNGGPPNGPPGQSGEPDYEIIGPTTVDLRAERRGHSGGRLYTVTVECADDTGHTDTTSVTVIVPHDQGQRPDHAKRGRGDARGRD